MHLIAIILKHTTAVAAFTMPNMDLADIFGDLKVQCIRLKSEVCPEVIYFRRMNERYSYMSNFYKSRLIIDGKMYHHVEGYFQSQKFAGINDEVAEKIRNMWNPMDTKRESRKHTLNSNQIQEWNSTRRLSVMRRAVLYKFLSNAGLANDLLSTGDATIVEDAPWDGYWGNGKDKNGLNMLGKILMETRDTLRKMNF